MKSLLFAAGAMAVAASPAMARINWDVSMDAAPQGPVYIDEVTLGEELAAHVEDIGARELDRLLEELRTDVERQLNRRGLLAEPGTPGAVELDLTLVMAVPNRPTFAQLSGKGDWNWDRRDSARRPLRSHLSLASFGLGETELMGSFTGADGVPLGEVTYSYAETDIYQAQYSATWTDVHRGIDNFANRLADTVVR